MSHVRAAVATAHAAFILMRDDTDHSRLHYFPRSPQPTARYVPPFAREALRKAGYRVLQ